jgi:hypothetical protein
MNDNDVYLERIELFKSATQVSNNDIAKKYLMKNNWIVDVKSTLK